MQVTASIDTNTALQAELRRLEQIALAELLKWGRKTPIERAFSFDLEAAVGNLIEFRDRHGLKNVQ